MEYSFPSKTGENVKRPCWILLLKYLWPPGAFGAISQQEDLLVDTKFFKSAENVGVFFRDQVSAVPFFR